MKITTREIIIHVRGLLSLKYNNVVLGRILHKLLVVLLETTHKERTVAFLKGTFESSLLSFLFNRTYLSQSGNLHTES